MSMREAAKSKLRRSAPGLQALILDGLARVRGAHLAPPDPETAPLGEAVRAGPFAGLRLGATAHGSVLPAKLLGSYEAELHPWIERIAARPYRRLVNVGAAEGYYAVGFARRMPEVEVIAVDPSPWARADCRRIAAANGVAGRVVVKAVATPGRLAAWAGRDGLVFMDCEGAEAGLLRPERAPGLAGLDILVELHDFLQPGVTELVRRRFEATHEIEICEQAERRPSDWSEGLHLREEQMERLLDEKRPADLRWAFLTARR